MSDSDEDERVDRLFEEGEELSEASRAAILGLGEDATAPLLELVTDETYWDETARGGGWAPIHAARLLGTLGDPAAIEPLYRTLYRCEPDAILDTAITRALQQFGEAAIEPGLEVLEELGDDFRDDLACVFAGLGLRRRVLFQVLVKNLVDNPLLGAKNLARYGDAEALDALHPMLNRLLLVAAEHPSRAEEAFAVAEAIEELDGEIRPDQAEQLSIIRDQKRGAEEILRRVKEGIGDHHHPDTHVNEHDLGRNDPCWCGSGRKYKQCHMREDEA